MMRVSMISRLVLGISIRRCSGRRARALRRIVDAMGDDKPRRVGEAGVGRDTRLAERHALLS